MFASRRCLYNTIKIAHHSYNVPIRHIVSAALVKELREKSGAPMMDCKKALETPEVGEDIKLAIEWLRKKGITKVMGKGNERAASEGLIGMFLDSKRNKVTLIEVNSETDFVGRNIEFQTFVASLAASVNLHFGDNEEVSGEELLKKSYVEVKPGNNNTNLETSVTVNERLEDLISRIRENIKITRAMNMTADGTTSFLTEYVHARVGQESMPSYIQLGRCASVIGFELTSKLSNQADIDLLRNVGKRLAMHTVASNPTYIHRKDIPQSVIDSETGIFSEQTLLENNALTEDKKKSNVQLERMIAGRVEKRLADMCLMSQAHLAEEGQPIISKYLTSVSQQLKNEVCVNKLILWNVGQK